MPINWGGGGGFYALVNRNPPPPPPTHTHTHTHTKENVCRSMPVGNMCCLISVFLYEYLNSFYYLNWKVCFNFTVLALGALLPWRGGGGGISFNLFTPCGMDDSYQVWLNSNDKLLREHENLIFPSHPMGHPGNCLEELLFFLELYHC